MQERRQAVGKKATKAEVTRRVEQVRELLLKRLTYTQIVEYGRVNWDLHPAQMAKYVARATRQIRATAENLDLTHELALALEGFDLLMAKQMAAGDYRGACVTLDKRIALLGLAAPLKIEHSGSVGIDLSSLTDAELAEYKRLLRKANGLPDA